VCAFDPARRLLPFYQFFINTEDSMVVEHLKNSPCCPARRSSRSPPSKARNPGTRAAQKALAREVTTLVHGPDALQSAVKASEILFGGTIEGVSEKVLPGCGG